MPLPIAPYIQPGLAVPNGDVSNGLFNSTSVGAYENIRIAKVGAGILYGFWGYSSKASDQFIMVFDSATTPSPGASPVSFIRVPSLNNFSGYFGEFGRSFTRGIVLANSTTDPLLTIGAADCWFDVNYL